MGDPRHEVHGGQGHPSEPPWDREPESLQDAAREPDSLHLDLRELRAAGIWSRGDHFHGGCVQGTAKPDPYKGMKCFCKSGLGHGHCSVLIRDPISLFTVGVVGSGDSGPCEGKGGGEDSGWTPGCVPESLLHKQGPAHLCKIQLFWKTSLVTVSVSHLILPLF